MPDLVPVHAGMKLPSSHNHFPLTAFLLKQPLNRFKG